jgi:hypothetical protein
VYKFLKEGNHTQAHGRATLRLTLISSPELAVVQQLVLLRVARYVLAAALRHLQTMRSASRGAAEQQQQQQQQKQKVSMHGTVRVSARMQQPVVDGAVFVVSWC